MVVRLLCMKIRFFRLLEALRASYWFVPSVMALLAILVGALIVWLDAGPAAGVLDGLGWYQQAKPDGAHQVLSTIAGSMITVAGVVFSITIVAIAYAASQFGPRILSNFLSDRGNQVTLGTFIATFAYCLVVLRTIRGGDDGAFVPQMAVMVGLLLALCSIAVLIYFIHHVPSSIHINNVVAHIGKQLLRSTAERFPADVGIPVDAGEQDTDRRPIVLENQHDEAQAVCAGKTGYIGAVDDEALIDAARRHNLMLKLHHVPGDYVFEDDPLVTAFPADQVSDSSNSAIRSCYSVGNNRTPSQDIFFLIDELVEIAARALSSGVNDPYTAMTCLDWLGAAASRLAQRRMPSAYRADEDGTLRVIALPQSFADYLERGFGRLRQYLARDMNATLHALNALAKVSVHCASPGRVLAVSEEADKLAKLAELELRGPALAEVSGLYRSLRPQFHRGADGAET